MRDTALRSDSGCFDHNPAKAAKGKAADVDELIIVGKPIHGGILAHGCGNEPVPKGQLTKRGRGEKLAHTLLIPWLTRGSPRVRSGGSGEDPFDLNGAPGAALRRRDTAPVEISRHSP